MILECCGSNMLSYFQQNKNKQNYMQNCSELFYAILLPAALATNMILGRFKLDSLLTRGNHIAGISTRTAVPKGNSHSQSPIVGYFSK